MRCSGYVRFMEDFDQRYLGTAAEGSGCLSKLFFTWVNRLMEKGAKNRIHGPRDVYDLPEGFSVPMHSLLDTDTSLLRMLHREFGIEFYSIGILKLISDLASLAAPLLLNRLLLFIDDPKISMVHGYLYAGGIFLASIIGLYRRYCISTNNTRKTERYQIA